MNPIKPRKTPTRYEVEEWARLAKRDRDQAKQDEAAQNHGIAAGRIASAETYEEAVITFTPIVEIYESANLLHRRIKTLHNAMEELPECGELIAQKVAAISGERETLLLQAKKLLGIAYKRTG